MKIVHQALVYSPGVRREGEINMYTHMFIYAYYHIIDKTIFRRIIIEGT